MPKVFPFNEKPDIIEMPPEEMNVRPGFDVANERVSARRSRVSAKMEELGIILKKVLRKSSPVPPKEKRLSSVVLGKITENNKLSSDEEEGEASNRADNDGVADDVAVEAGVTEHIIDIIECIHGVVGEYLWVD